MYEGLLKIRKSWYNKDIFFTYQFSITKFHSSHIKVCCFFNQPFKNFGSYKDVLQRIDQWFLL